MLRRLFPHPLLSIALTLVWLGLVNTVTVGNLLLGGFLGLVVPLITAPYWPDRPKLRNPLVAAEYVLIVLWDIIVANVQVAMIILFKPNDQIRSHWIVVPLELTSPEAITSRSPSRATPVVTTACGMEPASTQVSVIVW